MGQLVNGLLVIDKAHTVPQRALLCKPGLWAQQIFMYINYTQILTVNTLTSEAQFSDDYPPQQSYISFFV